MFDFTTPITKDTYLKAKWSCPPAAPTSLTELKQALDAGKEIAIGTEIPDEWNGESSPLIVVQNLNSANSSSYGGAEGVILQRKNLSSTAVVFNSPASGYYGGSTIESYLQNDYYALCSDELRSVVSSFQVPWFTGGAISYATNTFFLPSGIEVGFTRNAGEGIFWDYWKGRTGLEYGNDGTNPGRVLGQNVWLRSKGNYESDAGMVNTTGSISPSISTINAEYILPACFIAKS